MIVRLGLLDSDERYIKLLSNYFNEHSDNSFRIESYLFFDILSFQKFQSSGKKLDILLASTDIFKSSEQASDKALLVYLTEDASIQEWNGNPAICKFQKAGDLLRKIQGFAAQSLAQSGNYSLGTQGGVIAFMGSAGGIGTTTVAMGCAERMALLEKNTLYFSVQQNARPESVFQCGASMSDVYYAYREWKSMGVSEGVGKLQLRLKSMISADPESGVSCFSGFNLPLDALDIKASEVAELVAVLSGLYDIVIVDLENKIDDVLIEMLKTVDWLILVSDGTENTNVGMHRFIMSLNELNNSEGLLKGQIGVMYTKFGSASQRIKLPGFITDLGDIPRIVDSNQNEIVKNLKNSAAFALLEK